MANITYLVGAGASHGALPVVGEMSEKIIEARELLRNHVSNSNDQPLALAGKQTQYTVHTASAKLMDDFDWLSKCAMNHASIDTYAKKLYLAGHQQDLRRLKLALCAYFTLAQAGKKIDVRYDTFFASIIKMSQIMPENIKIVTWNYDTQFEMASCDYNQEFKDIATNAIKLQVRVKGLRKTSANGFIISKLNGVAAFHQLGDNQNNYLANPLENLNDEFYRVLLTNYINISFNTEYIPSISFAWERDSFDREPIVDYTTKRIADTEILVIIGYSFPFFNREVDRTLFDSMINLKKIYYQDINAIKLIDRLQAVQQRIDAKQIIPISETGQFFLPYEL
ncbi:hypothetical protein [Flagellimonas abyssi]|uniref:SIR2-like domain-containing protein n=1 Tax=Flagellimonas abyssi TaxID=2864871 RepID=A0ABS7EMU5_9FLAO|nr:hypothetical protein [Allomuricauda abyssi]MBW8198913.1 hypothetical protein [Allomuricauda abyssi]